ncbi:MAG: fused MFS/spermidine synthase, partial [Kiritimatiellae bacterium]|nr:fused MFS/spermidine synthase [Kiritimatiellia bacterium]
MGGAATVFVSGLSVMVLELVAGRLVAPYFGQSTCTWAALTGVTLAGVSLGNALGGWLSAKGRRPGMVAAVALLVGGAFCAALPYVLPLLGSAVAVFESFEARTAVFVIAAWLPPMLALGCITPSIAAACVRPERNGRDLGLLYFASMAGSALGSVLGGLYLPFAWPANRLYLFFGTSPRASPRARCRARL